MLFVGRVGHEWDTQRLMRDLGPGGEPAFQLEMWCPRKDSNTYRTLLPAPRLVVQAVAMAAGLASLAALVASVSSEEWLGNEPASP
jgi:hypothetical protein